MSSPPTLSPRPRILIVDREAAIRFTLSDYLRGHDLEVDAAEGPSEVEAWLARNSYAAVITDLQPHNPLAVAHRIRLVSPGTVVCLLAPPLTAEETRAALLAADVVLTRPRPLPEIAAVVMDLLTRLPLSGIDQAAQSRTPPAQEPDLPSP
jgi:DNA-binding response OmpR family regulator